MSITDEEFLKRFKRDLHGEYILSIAKQTGIVSGDEKSANEPSFEMCVTEHLRMSAVYWSLMALSLVKLLDKIDTNAIVKWVLSCQDKKTGGFAGHLGHDVHILYTLSAVQILAILNKLDMIDSNIIAEYIKNLQQPDGSFYGDEWGEMDTRFSYCAVNCLDLLGKLDVIDINNAMKYIESCRNFDGGFGAVPGAESHSGQVFCCVGALAIGNSLDSIDNNVLGWWLSERQLPCGGLNGRPEKKEDVCYSWWVLSSLSIMDKISWIDRNKLADFILSCQDFEDGGISDRSGNIADIFHTYFGFAGLSLLGYPNFEEIDPVYALPANVVKRLGLPIRYRK